MEKMKKTKANGRPPMEGKARQYVVADDVHQWIISHGGGRYITDTFRGIMHIAGLQSSRERE